MSNEKERAEFKRYKEDVKKRGKPFFPYAMLHDTIMCLVVVGVIIALACIWYFTSGEEAGDAGILGPRYTEKADPGTISFVPRPDWYFYFLFYLLRIFKWPESVVLGTVGIPTIALILLLALPFIDRRRERRLLRRPVAVIAALLVIASMAVLTCRGATAKESLAAENVELVAEWTRSRALSEEGAEGASSSPSRVPELPHLPRRRAQQPRCARPDRDRQLGQDAGGVRRLHRQPVRVRQHRHAAVREPGRRGPRAPRGLPRGVEGRGRRRVGRRPARCASSSGSRAPRALRMPDASCRRSPRPARGRPLHLGRRLRCSRPSSTATSRSRATT